MSRPCGWLFFTRIDITTLGQFDGHQAIWMTEAAYVDIVARADKRQDRSIKQYDVRRHTLANGYTLIARSCSSCEVSLVQFCCPVMGIGYTA